ncbi:MAG: hypothetical protein KDK01_12420 [Rhodobacteraceae bacterium]|jgi:hypothetical protein|nr:hypothetical protein [Paracoccaceae bacterium]
MSFRPQARRLVAPICFALALGGPLAGEHGARADTLSEAAHAIETLIAQGQSEDAVAAARQFLRRVTDQTGFGVTNARLIESPATGYGIYVPRESNTYLPGDPVYAYVEVYGFSLSSQRNGANRLMFDVAFTLDTPDGQQMTDAMIPMGEILLESFSEPVDGYFHLTYRVTGAEGAFNLRTRVTDRESGQSAEFVLPVVFAASTPQAAPAIGK